MSSSGAPSLPSTMKAAIRTGWITFGTDVVENHPTPAIPTNPDKILVKVHAAALNPVDYKLPKIFLGAVLGMDLCGTVVSVPANCTNPDLKVGDLITGPTTIGFSGAMAEYAICYASKVTKLPKNDDWTVEQGAALPIACGTAMEGFEQAGVLQLYKENDTKPPISSLLVIGASGGCGILALQLAKGMGIPRIVGICSSKNVDLCKSNGATEIVPYDDPTALEKFWKDNEGKIDMIYDAASYSGGGEDYCDNPKVVSVLPKTSRHSRYILLNGSLTTKVHAVTLGMIKSYQQTLIVLPKFSGDTLKLGINLLERAKMKPILDQSHDFTKDGIAEAYKQLQSRRTKGKLVISISKPEA